MHNFGVTCAISSMGVMKREKMRPRWITDISRLTDFTTGVSQCRTRTDNVHTTHIMPRTENPTTILPLSWSRSCRSSSTRHSVRLTLASSLRAHGVHCCWSCRVLMLFPGHDGHFQQHLLGPFERYVPGGHERLHVALAGVALYLSLDQIAFNAVMFRFNLASRPFHIANSWKITGQKRHELVRL